MRQAIQFAKRTNRWELLSTNLKPHLAEMPFLQELITSLDALAVQANALDKVQEVARSAFQDAVHKRQDLEKQGEVLRRRAESHLRGSFGFTSDDLVKFGIQPRKTGPRGSNKKPPVATPPPAVK
jgi:hypothetical protein